MVKLSLLSAAIVGVASASTTTVFAPNDLDLDQRFASWMKQYDKKYIDDDELKARREIFAETLLKIEELQRSEPEATFGTNQFADLTPEEFKEMHKGYRPMGNSHKRMVSNTLDISDFESTQDFDWRTTKPYPVTAVKNQGQCGSCWAFSATEGIESARIMQGGKSLTLAPQEIVSCDHVDLGCNGGDLPTAFQFVESLSTPTDIGLTENSKYPYTSGTSGVTGKCKKQDERHGFQPVQKAAFAIPPCSQSNDASCSSQAKLEPQMAAQMMKHGPLSICVDAMPWQTYTGGILKNAANCPGGQMDLDHCVQVVGYNKSGATPYWIVRNSWAESWGEKGFIYLEMGKNMCGIADEPMFVTDKVNEVASMRRVVEFVGDSPQMNHYEDPNTTGRCQEGELDVEIQGIQGKMCAPKCSASGACPTDVPAGVTAKPTCALQGMQGKYCALVCSPSTDVNRLRAGDAQCGKNASCKAISGVGICTYDA